MLDIKHFYNEQKIITKYQKYFNVFKMYLKRYRNFICINIINSYKKKINIKVHVKFICIS